MRSKKIIVIFGIISILFLACFLFTGNMTTSGSLTALDTPDIVTDINFDTLKSSDATNLEIIESIFDSKNDDYSTYGYYPQIYSDSLQATYYALFILDSIGKLDEIDQGEVITYLMSHYNSSSHQFLDTSAKRYLSSIIPNLYWPLTTLLEVNCYAVLSLDILNALSLIDTAETIDFIWNCYHPDLHGFIGQPYDASLDEGFKIPTADNTYYAVITLDLLISDWNSYSQERTEIVSYIDGLQSVGSHTGFYNDNEPIFDSLFEIEPNQFASFYSIKTLETFGSSYIDVIDIDKFHQDLNDLYYPEDFYFDISSIAWSINYTNIVATAINLELSDLTSFTGFNRARVIDFIIDNRNILGGWDASTTTKYHELIDTFQILRSLANTGALSELTLSAKNEIASFIRLFSQFNGYTLLSEDYTSIELIHTMISSHDYFDRIADLDIQELYNLLEESVLYMGGKYYFFACTQRETNVPNFRSKPFDYYTLGFHKHVEEINVFYSHKETYKILSSLQKIFKLNDFASSHDLNSVLINVINSQFMDFEYQENFGAFLFHNTDQTPEWKNKLIYLQYSFYAIKVMELIADYLGLGIITNLGFDESALATYIIRNIVESPAELYFDVEYTTSAEIALENTYYAIYVLKAINEYNLDSIKIENFMLSHLNYSNVKNLYYCYKISEILGLQVVFDVEQSHTLIQSIYSSSHREFFESTERSELEQEAFAWVCEMAKNDQVRVNAQYSDSIPLGENNLISVELCNLILSNFGQYTTVKLESEQLGTILFDQMDNYTYQKEIRVPIDPLNYPLIEGELSVYDGSLKIAQFPISFQTTLDSIYSVSTSKTESRIEITVVASLRFSSGEQPVYDGIMRTEVYRDDTYVDTIFFTSEDDLKSTTFTLIYQPSYSGNYRFEIYIEDPYHSSSQFITDITYTYKDSNPIQGDDPFPSYESDANLTIPLAIVILTVGSGGFASSLIKSKKKVKDKPNFKVK
jgi:prenyltransferase beta subunit